MANWITWQNPEVWTHKGYKCYMYQSYNEYLNYRLLKMIRPDGSEVIDPVIPLKNNISSSAKRTQEWLREKINWDMKSDEEKAKITEKYNKSQQFLF